MLLGCLSAPAVTAQSVLRGRVVADSGRRPIAGAEVVITAVSLTARSDADGRFTLGGLHAGRLAIRIRAVGFKPLDLEADIGAADTADVEFELTRAPQQLAPLVVQEKAPPRPSGKMEVFESRRRMGFGRFLDRAQLAKWEAHSVSDAMRRTANLMLVARSAGCGGGFAASTGRGGGHIEPCTDSTPRCYLAVYLDGLLVWSPGMGAPPNVDEFRVDGLQGVEIYVWDPLESTCRHASLSIL